MRQWIVIMGANKRLTRGWEERLENQRLWRIKALKSSRTLLGIKTTSSPGWVPAQKRSEKALSSASGWPPGPARAGREGWGELCGSTRSPPAETERFCLGWVAPLVGPPSPTPKGASAIPRQGTELDCRLYPCSGCVPEATDWCFCRTRMSLKNIHSLLEELLKFLEYLTH